MPYWVVVVDDDVVNLKMAGQILSKSNMRVSAVKSGEALLEFMADNNPDLILLDIMMPGIATTIAIISMYSGWSA